ncbi:MAG: ABC transporter permease [Spirochaetales bacterium]|nr:ABC transporter permease [Spirochaetales bacterium]
MFTFLGRWLRQKIKTFFYVCGFLSQVMKETVRFFGKKQAGYKVMTMQILFTGVEALSVVALLALALGAVIIIQGVSLLPQFGQGSLIYNILIIVITRELGPLLTAFIIIARSGTAISTELGNMVVSHEIEAYISVGIHPISYLVVPRFLGVTFSLLLLTVYFNMAGLIGSYFITQLFSPIPLREYFTNLLYHLRTVDIVSSLIKSFVFGIIISAVATFNGFRVEGSTTEIPQVAIRAVGQSLVYIIFADAIITMISYL